MFSSHNVVKISKLKHICRLHFVFNHDSEYGFMSGMQSFHSNGHEDRKFQFFFTIPKDHKIGEPCHWRTVNGFDEVLRSNQSLSKASKQCLGTKFTTSPFLSSWFYFILEILVLGISALCKLRETGLMLLSLLHFKHFAFIIVKLIYQRSDENSIFIEFGINF